VADIAQARPGLGGRERVRAESNEGARYRTFPARLPTLLTATGGLFVAAGALGAALRASALLRSGADPITVRTLMGFRTATGWVIAVTGVLLAVSAFTWLRRSRIAKLLPLAISAGVAAVVAVRLVALNDRAATWATQARRAPRFIGFHAGLGWGAWALLAGAIFAGFGVLVGVLREIDLRKGYGA